MSKNPPIDFTRVFDIIDYQQKKYPQSKALNSFINGKWRAYSTEEIQQKANSISNWFLENEFQKGDKIVIVPNMGRPEWIILDFACQQVGLIVVPVSPSLLAEEIQFILKETEARMCITADSGLYYKVHPLAENVPGLDVYHLEPKEPGFFHPMSLHNSRTSTDKLKEIKDAI